MGWLFDDDDRSSEQRRTDDAYTRGSRDARKDDLIDRGIHDFFDAMTCVAPQTRESKAYHDGYHETARTTEPRSSREPSGSSLSGGTGYSDSSGSCNCSSCSSRNTTKGDSSSSPSLMTLLFAGLLTLGVIGIVNKKETHDDFINSEANVEPKSIDRKKQRTKLKKGVDYLIANYAQPEIDSVKERILVMEERIGRDIFGSEKDLLRALEESKDRLNNINGFIYRQRNKEKFYPKEHDGLNVYGIEDDIEQFIHNSNVDLMISASNIRLHKNSCKKDCNCCRLLLSIERSSSKLQDCLE